MTMKDYDIRIEGRAKINVFGTKDGTVLFPSTAKIDTDRSKTDVNVKNVEEVKIGIPDDCEKVEIACDDANLSVQGITFEDLEIDGKGTLTINLADVRGYISINLMHGHAKVFLPEGFSFRTANKGKDCLITNARPEDANAETVIELNGRDSSLTIA